MADRTRTLVSRRELATMLGTSAAQIGRLVAAGLPQVRAGGGPGRPAQYDAVAALTWWRGTQLDVAAGSNGAASARDRYLELLGERVKVELAAKRGQLVARDQVILAGQHSVRALVAKVRALPRQLVNAGALPREREGAATTLCRDMLLEISGWKTLRDLQRAARSDPTRRPRSRAAHEKAPARRQRRTP